MVLGDEVPEVTLETSRSTRGWLAGSFVGGLALLASAFLAGDAMPDRTFRGIVGVAASSYFGAYLVWAVSHRIFTTRDALISRSILGTIEVPWPDIDFAGYHDPGEAVKTDRAAGAERQVKPGRDFLVESRVLKREIKIRDDLEPAAARKRLIALIHDGGTARRQDGK